MLGGGPWEGSRRGARGFTFTNGGKRSLSSALAPPARTLGSLQGQGDRAARRRRPWGGRMRVIATSTQPTQLRAATPNRSRAAGSRFAAVHGHHYHHHCHHLTLSTLPPPPWVRGQNPRMPWACSAPPEALVAAGPLLRCDALAAGIGCFLRRRCQIMQSRRATPQIARLLDGSPAARGDGNDTGVEDEVYNDFLFWRRHGR